MLYEVITIVVTVPDLVIQIKKGPFVKIIVNGQDAPVFVGVFTFVIVIIVQNLVGIPKPQAEFFSKPVLYPWVEFIEVVLIPIHGIGICIGIGRITRLPEQVVQAQGQTLGGLELGLKVCLVLGVIVIV